MGPSKVSVQREAPALLLARCGAHDARLLVLADALLEEVRLALQGDELHPVEGVGGAEELLVAQGREQPVRDELDVARHELAVHADEVAGEGLADEAALHLHGAPEDGVHDVLRKRVPQHAVEEAGKLRVQALVPGDELVGEGEAGHEAALLEPVDGAEGAAEEHALHRRKGHEALCEAALAAHPLNGPARLLPHRRHGLDGVEDLVLLRWVPDILLDKQRVGLRVDVLHGHLEAVEGTGLRQLHLGGELLRQVLVDDAVGGREEGEDVLDEVLLGVREPLPVPAVLREVHLLRGPEGGLVLLVHLPDLGVLDGEHHPAPRVLHEQRVLRLQRPVLR
mmetsp:Transcript_47386/g.146682  ORF Transcript_47386/g.146682 Transcript_47386/m.146682 type:complete len:337 (-) Transcript_47386:146-1156(-)